MDTDDVLHAINTLPDPLHPSTQMARRAAAEIERLRDKCGGLGEDLIAAVGAAYNAGAVDWVKKNYPDFPAFDYERSTTDS